MTTSIPGSNRVGEKIQTLHNVQNSLVNQQRTSEMMRCSLTYFNEARIYGLPVTWINFTVMYQLREIIGVIIVCVDMGT